MTFVVAATVGVGLYSANRAGKAADRASALDAEALAFAKEQYADWKEIYGALEDQLSTFYNELTPDYIEAQGLQNQAQQYEQVKTQMTEFFAVNEIDSGASADLFTKASLSDARSKAEIRTEAPFKTAELKQSFLSLGLNAKGSRQGAVTNALNTSANRAAGDASQGFDAAGQAFASAVDLYRFRDRGTQTATANQGRPFIQGGGPGGIRSNFNPNDPRAQ